MTGNLSKELLEKAMGAGSKEEAFEILRQGGVNLSEEDLQNISGGEGDGAPCLIYTPKCPKLCVLDRTCISYDACPGYIVE